MFLVIDNYDSFVHNLARYFELAKVKTCVVRNDQITLDEIKALKPEAIVISPGPCTPKEAGICVDAVKKFGANTPILGVCLGHQSIGAAYGARIPKAKKPMHGKASLIRHDRTGVFKDLPNPLNVGRYHSLIIEPDENTPLRVIAKTDDGEIMAIAHTTHPVYGVQFHPESIMTDHGLKIIKNFAALSLDFHASKKGKAA